MYYEVLDDAVTLYRKKRGMTQEDLAREMNMAPATLAWKLNGKRNFTLPEAIRLSEMVGVPLDGLTGRELEEAV